MRLYRPLIALSVLSVLATAGCAQQVEETQAESSPSVSASSPTATAATSTSATPTQSPTSEPTGEEGGDVVVPSEDEPAPAEAQAPEQGSGEHGSAVQAAPAQAPESDAPLPGQPTGHIPDPVPDTEPVADLIPAGVPTVVGTYFGNGRAPVEIASPGGATGALTMFCGEEETGRSEFNLAANETVTESLSFSGQQCTLEVTVDTGEITVSPQTPVYS